MSLPSPPPYPRSERRWLENWESRWTFTNCPWNWRGSQAPRGRRTLVTFLEGRLKEQPVDLVVPVGTAGMQFAAKHRDRLFPSTPVLVVASEPRMMSPELLRTNATAVTQRVSLPGMVEDILQLQPQTTNIVVVFGASALERFWTEQCRREFQVFTNRVGFTWVNDLTLGQTSETLFRAASELVRPARALHRGRRRSAL